MRAVVLEGPRSVAVESVPDPVLPGPHGALIAVEHTAICGSDLHVFHGGLSAPGVCMGHEGVGRVLEVGSEVHSVSPGDRVIVSGVIGCGTCASCLAGDPPGCRARQMTVYGTTPDLPGAQAELMAVPHVDVFARRVPDDCTPEQAVLLTDILPTAFLAARHAAIEPGATVAVFGLGPVGALAVQCAQLFGPARVLAVDTVADRLARAHGWGAEPVDASGGRAVAEILERTGGWGADAVIEAVGLDQTIVDAIGCASPGATVSIVGVNVSMALPFPMALVLLNKLTVRATVAAIPGTWDALVPLLGAGRLRPDGVVTHRMPLSEAAEAYRMFDERDPGVLKILLDPTT